MNKNKQSLKATFAEALQNYQKRDFKTAEIFCYKILSIDTNHFDSLSLLANIFAINKNFDKAAVLKNLSQQVRLQVDFVTQIERLFDQHGVANFVEISPEKILGRLIEDVLIFLLQDLMDFFLDAVHI